MGLEGFIPVPPAPGSALAKLDEKTKKLLLGKNFIFVSTINKDGSPQLTPTWVDTDGENVLINSALGRQKVVNVARDPRVAIAVVNHENPYERVSIKGKVVEEITGKAAEDHIDKMSLKYTGEPKYRRNAPGEKRVLLVVKPLKVY